MDVAREREREKAKEMKQQKMGGWAKGGENLYNGRRGRVAMQRWEERVWGGDKVVNERGLSRVLRLYKVGSEGLTEVLWSTACDQ